MKRGGQILTGVAAVTLLGGCIGSGVAEKAIFSMTHSMAKERYPEAERAVAADGLVPKEIDSSSSVVHISGMLALGNCDFRFSAVPEIANEAIVNVHDYRVEVDGNGRDGKFHQGTIFIHFDDSHQLQAALPNINCLAPSPTDTNPR